MSGPRLVLSEADAPGARLGRFSSRYCTELSGNKVNALVVGLSPAHVVADGSAMNPIAANAAVRITRAHLDMMISFPE
jgi:hypothetical protein